MPAADDQPTVFELAQVVGDGGAGHAGKRGEIQHTLLAVAEKPENAQPAAVIQQAENSIHKLKL